MTHAGLPLWYIARDRSYGFAKRLPALVVSEGAARTTILIISRAGLTKRSVSSTNLRPVTDGDDYRHWIDCVVKTGTAQADEVLRQVAR